MKPFAVLVALVLLVASAAPAAAQGCTMQNLAGAYVFESKGSSAIVSGPAAGFPNHFAAAYAPMEVIGRMTISADGDVTGFYWGVIGSAGGTVTPTAWTGTISNFENCVGIITYNLAVAGGGGMMAQVKERFVMVDGGMEFRSVMTQFTTLTTPPRELSVTWNTTGRRTTKAGCSTAAMRGSWAMTCQSLHALGAMSPSPSITHMAEAALIRSDVAADGTFTGWFESRIGPNHVLFPVGGSFEVDGECRITGEMQAPAVLPGMTIIAKGVVFGEGKEFLAIPVATTDGTTTWGNAYDSCRAIRVGR